MIDCNDNISCMYMDEPPMTLAFSHVSVMQTINALHYCTSEDSSLNFLRMDLALKYKIVILSIERHWLYFQGHRSLKC